ncbi:MMPL family transporter [Paraconexibacter antarcticus]|uniref:MMPL family transporter n=1 Tax=Paraconexibacter antarcticus TaxID=2949664 RepID=A0ABY5DZS6_9ACTN|nr:MMPL family transporter [Paraconexibacter antarcticus]UTI66853.1 MMPL family transporter [Paraconexibacter antarcticus]
MGRAGAWFVEHSRAVAVVWVVLVIGLGAFAPRVEKALSGAGWEASGSESVLVRNTVDREFGGLSSYGLSVVLHSPTATTADPAFRQTITRVEGILKGDSRVSTVVPPQPGASISRDGHTAIVAGGAGRDSNEMVRVADDLKGPLKAAGSGDVRVALTGASGLWSDFNKANLSAMLHSELVSWPVTMLILVLAFGALVAAGLPLMLTILGLVATAGSLYLMTLITPVSVWAMNFALMFALALGIDYALFFVVRYRAALFGEGRSPAEAAATTMDSAGKAILFSGVTVMVSLSAVMLVPSPAFRSMALGIMLSVVFVLAATLTLLPVVLARLGHRVNRMALPWAKTGEHRSARFEAWGRRLWKRPHVPAAVTVLVLLALAIPALSLNTGMPSIKVLPKGDSARVGYDLVQAGFGKGAPGTLQVIAPAGDAAAVATVAKADPNVVQVSPPQTSRDGRTVLLSVVPQTDPSAPATGATIDRLRRALPPGAKVGGAAAENHDLEHVLATTTPYAIGMVLALGFLLLLVALQAPLLAFLGVISNLLAVGAAFGVAKWIFQDGALHSLLGFESQGFLDAWGPIFFFAMIFAISMDYTLFLLSSAKEHWDRTGDPEEAMVGGLAHSGRVIFAAGGVMVAVFFTFALSGPLPPKEMGVILGIAVLLDAALIRLLLVPAILAITGRAAWWLPKPLERVLPKVRFGH